MNIQQWIINLASKLRKQYPEQDGAFAIVMNTPPSMSLDEGFEGDPMADNRPEWLKKDDAGWQRITDSKRK